MPQKLNQVLAIEKSAKQVREKAITDAYHVLQKPPLFEGFQRTYEPLAEGDDKLPAERQLVQFKVNQVLDRVRQDMTEVIDIVATKDAANCRAKAPIVVGAVELAKDVPATTLLFLEKQLTDLRTEITKAPELDTAEEWSFDKAAGYHKTEPKRTVRTKKVPRVITLAPATDKHAAQAQLVHEDVSAGFWAHQRFSGAIAKPEKERLLRRLEELARAVKFAREQANETEAPDVKIADSLFAWLLE